MTKFPVLKPTGGMLCKCSRFPKLSEWWASHAGRLYSRIGLKALLDCDSEEWLIRSFLCRYFNSLRYAVLIRRMICKWWFGMCVEGDSCTLFYSNILVITWTDWEKPRDPSISIASPSSKFEPGTYRIRNVSANKSTTTFGVLAKRVFLIPDLLP